MSEQPKLQPEFERKYILKRIPQIDKWYDHYFIEQFYIPESDGSVRRVRYAYELDSTLSFGKIRNIECIYKQNMGIPGVNMEHHYKVTREEADVLIENATKKIQKTRYVYMFNFQKYEIDSFVGMSLTMLEIELDDINRKPFVPEAINNEIIMDVTELPGNPFSNAKLAKKIK